jgi:hypothetical protein
MHPATGRAHGKKGALPPDPARPRLRLGPAIRGTAPSAAHFGHIPTIGLLGNDVWDDCVFACAGHLAESVTFFGQGTETVITEAQALALYAYTGFDISAGPPGDNPTDQGATLQDGLQLMVTYGVGGVEFTMYGELDVKNTNQWQQALATFGPLMLGVGVGDIEQQQFDEGSAWTLVPGAAPNQEDHCVMLSGYQPGMYWCQTWGALQAITPAWFEVNAYEVWAPISSLWVSTRTGRDPEGVSLDVLGSLFAELTGQPDPFAQPHGPGGF